MPAETTKKLELRANPGGCDRLLEMVADKMREVEADRARLIHALSRVDIDCAYCAHKDRHAEDCKAADLECERCRVAECPCRECNGKNWTWNGGGETAERS